MDSKYKSYFWRGNKEQEGADHNNPTRGKRTARDFATDVHLTIELPSSLKVYFAFKHIAASPTVCTLQYPTHSYIY